MTRARRKEGPCAPLFYSVAALLLFAAKITAAQSVDLSSLEFCANLETPELKLACFEAIVATGKSSEEQVSKTTVQSAPDNEQAPTVPGIAVTTAPDIEPKTTESVAVIAVAPENDADANEPEPVVAERPVPIEVAPEDTSAVSVTQSTEDFEREPLDAPKQAEKKEVITALVVDVTQSYNRSLNFHLSNGHVWRQIEPRRFQYPKDREFEVHISQGMMGEYRMRIGENGRMVRIRRVQ